MEQEQEKKKFITTAISYANSTPHIGHAFEFIIADALSRYYRMKGEETFFLTGNMNNMMQLAQLAQLMQII
jgi:methionyl-tRNA synthetase